MNSYLSQSIQYLPGVGPKRAALLEKELHIKTLSDLLYYFPYKHIDRTRFYSIREIRTDEPSYIQIRGRFTQVQQSGKPHKERIIATFCDATGSVPVIFFKGLKYISSTLRFDTDYILFGKPSVFNGQINFVHPELELAQPQAQKIRAALQSQYNTTEKLKNQFITSATIRKLMGSLWQGMTEPVREVLPEYLIKQLHLMPLHQALFQIHFPQSNDLLRQAEYRLKFEELFYLQLFILKHKAERQLQIAGYRFDKVGDVFHTFYTQHLPFSLTDAQKRVVREIRQDMGSGRQMNRLLQGDVGSGKTLVALLCMLIAIDNGFQTCLMAPTEILAQQHFQTISRMTAGLPVKTGLLTGTTTVRQRQTLREGLLDGSLSILIGTHALIEDTVQFRRLGLVIIDEQHRFGVAQRAEMWQKSINPPHILVMTATPIPRTLAMTLYGDLDVSVIDELPPGRKAVVTRHLFDAARYKVFDFMKQQIARGRQIYYVFPLIAESEALDYENLEQGFAMLREVFPDHLYQMTMAHGKMKPAEKEAAMRAFKSGEAQILVATTVIEVGVDVPNASVMVIESAERFGLSQLHQLRGRVGRGADQSYCILLTPYKLSSVARQRLQTMVSTSDGFQIAEADLRLRGQGDIEGTQQSGKLLDLQIADLAHDQQILHYARQIAGEVIQNDPELTQAEHRILREQLALRNAVTINWGRIS